MHKNFPDEEKVHKLKFRDKKMRQKRWLTLGTKKVFQNMSDNLQFKFPDSLDSSRLSGQFPYCPNFFQTARQLPNFPDSNQTFQTVTRLFQYCSDSWQFPGSLWTVQTVSRLSGKFLDCPDSFQTCQKISTLF